MATLHATTPQGYSGLLSKSGQHVFAYAPEVVAARDGGRSLSLSLTMPVRPESYATTPMLPVFQTFLPEGFLAQRIIDRFSKTLRMDDMALLALSSANAIGRIRLGRTPHSETGAGAVESLKEILESPGSRNLFEELCDRYLIASGIAGVQPKVLVEAADDLIVPKPTGKASIGEKSTLRGRSLIIKVSGDDYPSLADNEFHCLSIARSLRLPVPAFWISDDRKRLAIERFDIDRDSGAFLGFEDMVSLQGKVNDRKYEGTYENVALAIGQNVSPAWMQQSLNEFFASLVLSMAVKNGDAHLKNFGLLYTHPEADDCRLSPIYDVVCTTVYLPGDLPALSLAGRKAWPSRDVLEAFGREHCRVDAPGDVIERVVTMAMDYRPDSDESGMWKRMKVKIDDAARSLDTRSHSSTGTAGRRRGVK